MNKSTPKKKLTVRPEAIRVLAVTDLAPVAGGARPDTRTCPSLAPVACAP